MSKEHGGGTKSGYLGEEAGEEADGEDEDRGETKKGSNVITLNGKEI